MAGNDQDTSQMTSVPQAMGDEDAPPVRDPQIINQALAQPVRGGLSTDEGTGTPPMGGLAAISAPQPDVPPTAQNSFLTQPNQTQDYLDQIMAIQKEIKNQTNSSQVPWFQLASAFLNPGKTGSFGEALGSAAGAMGKYQEEQQARKLPLMQAGLKAEEIRQGIVNNQKVQDLADKAIIKDKNGFTATDPAILQQIAALDPTKASAIQAIAKATRESEAPAPTKLAQGETLTSIVPVMGKDGTVTYQTKEIAAGGEKMGEGMQEVMSMLGYSPKTKWENLSPQDQEAASAYLKNKNLPQEFKLALAMNKIPITTDLNSLPPATQNHINSTIDTLKKLAGTNISVNTAETGNKEIVKAATTNMMNQIEGAQNLTKQTKDIEKTLDLLNDPRVISGWGAGTKAEIENALASAGLKSPEARDKTMQVIRDIANITKNNLPIMKAAVGTHVNMYQTMMEKASIGDLSMGAEALRDSLHSLHDDLRTMAKNAKGYQSALGENFPETKKLVNSYNVDIPDQYQPKLNDIPFIRKDPKYHDQDWQNFVQNAKGRKGNIPFVDELSGKKGFYPGGGQ